MTSRNTSRRGVLKFAGAGLLTGALGISGAGVARAAEDVLWDAVVVGAGYAGVTAARELAARGLNTVILEARDRVGGRIHTSDFAGTQVELGGGWFGPGQHLVERELARYHIATTPDVSPTVAVMPGTNGFTQGAPADVFSRLGALFTEFYRGSEVWFERPSDPLFRADLLRDVDRLSLADRIGQMTLSPVEHGWVAGSTAPFAGGNAGGGFTGLAQWYQLAGGTYDAFHATMSLKPAGGMISVLQAMLNESRVPVRLNSAVTAVTQSTTGLTSVRTADGRTHRARVVVMATPVNTWRTVDFRPGLPTAHADASREGVGVPHATKLWLRVRGGSEAVYAQDVESGPIQMLMPQQQLSDGRMYVAFSSPGLDVTNQAAVAAAVHALIPGGTLVGYRVTEWAKDPWAKGGWGLRRPGQLLRQLPAVQQPHGHVVFAGSDIASGWYGAFVEGALESGFRAADQALALAG
ncbi:flavin monoamine oxidase family protein [Streptomyces sp. BI20]|uniref:flavin monoamine oxidase family protein n=1 Tax=Streptomyces sp. BI20 TaxID=3403460 RepID=UPI003C715030